jgi:hypothetical protein
LSGDVTGTQSATMIAGNAVGSSKLASDAASLAKVSGGVLVNSSGNIGIGTNSPTSKLTVAGDASAINGWFTRDCYLDGNLHLPMTTASANPNSVSAGVIYFGGFPFFHIYGPNGIESYNFFAGGYAGNQTMTGIDNTGVGFEVLQNNTSGALNTAIGNWALSGNTSGNYNVASGAYALSYNTTGNYNTANGYNALRNNTNGALNTAIGCYALWYNTSGGGNTANGYQALSYNTTGNYNTAIGCQALEWNKVGNYNTANGYEALAENTNGTGNTAFGFAALSVNPSGSYNTAIGSAALGYSTSGSNNIALGNYAGNNITTGSYNIDIGNQGAPTDNGVIRIGTTNTQYAAYIAGIYASPVIGEAVYVTSAGKLGILVSYAAQFKTNIQEMAGASDALLALRPVTFQYTSDIDPAGTPQFGLVAEEVEKVNPSLVKHDEKGRPHSVRYEQVNAMLLNEFLKEHRKVQDLEQRLEKLEWLLNARTEAANQTARNKP